MSEDYHFEVKKKRPEEIYNEVADYFKGDWLSKYATSKSIMRIQEKMIIRALELLKLEKENVLILDAGCGPGFAGIYLKEIGYDVVAIDIISNFLSYYDISEINPIASDMCYLPFKPESFDAIISISALQWVFRDLENIEMRENLINLARTCYSILKPKSQAIFQFYPKNNAIMKEMGKIIAENTKFKGNFTIDNPNNPKKRKIFLSLQKK